MADPLPSPGYITNTGRTTGEVRAALDDIVGVLARLLGAVAAESAEITTGALAPSAAIVQVDNEGSVGTDFLDSVSASNYSDGNLVLLLPLTTANTTTIRHDQGVDGIQLADATNWPLTSSRWLLIRYVASSSRWVEVSRGYGVNDHSGFRDALGLGTAALLNDGAVDAATLGGVAASGYIEVGDPVSDADTVDGLHASELLQLALGSVQEVAGNIQVNSGALISNINTGDFARLILSVDDVRRGEVFFSRDSGTPADSYLTMRIYDTDGTTLLREIKFAAGADAPTFELDNGGTVKTFSFVEDLPPNLIGATIQNGSDSGALDENDLEDRISLDENYFSLAIHAEDNRPAFLAPNPTSGPDADRAVPLIAVRLDPDATGTFNTDWTAEWKYFVFD